jgi:hypothetical protein
MMEDNKSEFIKVEVQGKDTSLWRTLQPKLIQTIHNFLNTVIDSERNTTIREEAKKFTSALLDYGKQKLEKAGLENDKIIAEVDLIYSQKEKEIAETRKIHAEADAIEFNTNIKKLRFSLLGIKVLMVGEKNEEELIFLKQVEEFISVIKEIEKENNLLI